MSNDPFVTSSPLPNMGEGGGEGWSDGMLYVLPSSAPHLRQSSGGANLLPNWGEGNAANISIFIKLIAQELRGFSDAPQIDAERIVLHALDKREPSYLLAHSDEQLSPEQMARVQEMVRIRKTGMPLAYILREADFYGRTFMVTPDVLIPRPDTELLIEKALEYIARRHAGLDPASSDTRLRGSRIKSGMTRVKEITIADIGTGSGCIAITLALELRSTYNLQPTNYQLIATDVSDAALTIARKNAKKHGVLDQIEFIQGDMLAPLQERHIDLIVSNPPYITTQELTNIRHPGLASPSVAWRSWDPGSTSSDRPGFPIRSGMTDQAGLRFEPRIALDGGSDGQLFVNQIKQSGIPAIVETMGGEVVEIL